MQRSYTLLVIVDSTKALLINLFSYFDGYNNFHKIKKCLNTTEFDYFQNKRVCVLNVTLEKIFINYIKYTCRSQEMK